MAEIVTTVVGNFKDEITPGLSEIQKKINSLFDGMGKNAQGQAKIAGDAFAKEFKTAGEVEAKAKRDAAIASNELTKAVQNELKSSQEYIKSKVEAQKATQQLAKAQQEAIKSDKDAIKSKADLVKASTSVRNEVMKELSTDKEMINVRAEGKNQMMSYAKSVKELAQAEKERERVANSLAKAEGILAATEAKVASGAMTLKEAEQDLMKNAKALATEIMALEKSISESGKATTEQTQKLKQLYEALDTMKEAADEAGDAQNKYNKLLQNGDERYAANLKSVGMMTGALTGLAGTMSKVFGDGAASMVDFAGSASNAASGFADMVDQLKAAKDMQGGFQSIMGQATAYIGMAQMGIQLLVQAFTMLDQGIRKQEQAIIDQGKQATEMTNVFKSYELGNKTMGDRIALIDKVVEKDQKMASSLRAVANDSEKFSAVLKKVTEDLRATREAGMGMEWKTEQTGGGLIGWFKSAGTSINEMAAAMGKARVAIDELRQNVSQTGADLAAATSAGTTYSNDVQMRIFQMDIQILQKKGMIQEARKKEIELLDLEKEKVIQLIKEKQTEIKLREADAKIQKARIMESKSDLDKIVRNMENTTSWISEYLKKTYDVTTWNTEKGERVWKKWTADINKTLETAVGKAIELGDASVQGVVKVLNQTLGSTQMQIGEKLKNIGLGDLLIGENQMSDRDLQNYVTALLEIKPALNEVAQATDLYKTANAELNNQLDSVSASFEQLKNKQWELWKAEDDASKKDEKKPVVKPTKSDVENAIQNLDNILAGYKQFESQLKNMNFSQLDSLTYDLGKRLKELEHIEIHSGLDQSIVTEREEIIRLLNKTTDAYKELEKSISAITDGISDSIGKAQQKLNDLMAPPVDDITKKIRESDRAIDDRIDKAKAALRAQLDLGNITFDYYHKMTNELEGQRKEWKLIQNEIIVIEANQGKLTDSTEDWASKTQEGKSNLQGAAGASDIMSKKIAETATSIANLTAKVNGFKFKFDKESFHKDFNEALNGAKAKSIIEKLKENHREALDVIDNGSMALQQKAHDEFMEATKDMDETSQLYRDKERELGLKLVDIANETCQKKLDLARKNAIDIANAYRSELTKLEQMEAGYQNRLKDREKLTGDARADVAKYVTRAKLDEANRQAYDQADSLGAEYERYRKAGMKESELEEWLNLKKKEMTKGFNADQLAAFEKFWNDRKGIADAAAKAEQEAWDNETNRQKQAIQDQIDLVDQLRKLAIQAKQDLLNLLGTKEGADAATRGTASNPIDVSERPPMPEDPPPDGWEWVYDERSHSWIAKLKSGASSSPAPAPEPPKDEKGQSGEKKENPEFVPIETSGEIQARIDAYKELENIALAAEAKIKEAVTNTRTEMEKMVKDNILSPIKSPGKEWVEGWRKIGEDAMKAMRKPLDAYIKDRLVMWEAAEWGASIIHNFTIGMQSGAEALEKGILDIIAEKIAKYLESHSPPLAGPLHYIQQWGMNIWSPYAEGIEMGASYVEDSITRVANRLEKIVGKLGSQIGDGFADGVGTGFQSVEHMMKEYGQTYQEELLGYPVLEGSTEGDVFQSWKNKLLSNKEVNAAYNTRQEYNSTKQKDYEAFYKTLGIASNKSSMDSLAGFYNSDLTKKSDEEFYSWFMVNFDKQLIPPDLGEVGIEHVKHLVSEHPEWKSWYPLQRKLNEQYPELLQELFNKGVLIPVNASRIVADESGNNFVVGAESDVIKEKYKTKGSIADFDPSKYKTIGWYQEGVPFDKNSVDSMMDNISGVDTFSDFLQKKFVKEQLNGDSGNLSDWWDARNTFLQGFDISRIKDLVSEYVKYVNGTTKLQSSGEAISDILKEYGDTDIAMAINSGKSMEEVLNNSKWATLMGDEFSGKDKQELAGGGWYDKSGNEIYDKDWLKQLMTGVSGGGVGTSEMLQYIKRQAEVKGIKSTILATGMDKLRSNLGNIQGDIKIGNMNYAGRDQNGHYHYEWLVVPPRPGMISEKTKPCVVVTLSGDELISLKRYHIYKLTGEEVDAVGGDQKSLNEARKWIYAIVDVSKDPGHRIEDSPFYATDQQLQNEIAEALSKLPKLEKEMQGGTWKEGSDFSGLTYKNKYKTVKGDYASGISDMASFFGGLSESQKGSVLENLANRIDEYYKNEDIAIPGASGEVQGGDARNPGGTLHVNNELVRKTMKAYLAKTLGYSDEFSIARGWSLSDDNTDATNLAFEELIKNVDFLNDELEKVVGTSEDVSEAQSELADAAYGVHWIQNDRSKQDEVMEYVKNLLKDETSYNVSGSGETATYTLKSDILKQIQEGMQYAYQNELASESDINALIKQLLPEGVTVPKEIIGLPGYNPESGLKTSPWGPFGSGAYNEGTWSTIGRRYFLGGEGGVQLGFGQGFANPTDLTDAGQHMRYDPYQYQQWLGYAGAPGPYGPMGMAYRPPTTQPEPEYQLSSGGGTTYMYINFNNTRIEGVANLEQTLVDLAKKCGWQVRR